MQNNKRGGLFEDDLDSPLPVKRDPVMVENAIRAYWEDYNERFKFDRWTHPHIVKNLIGIHGMGILEEIGDLSYEQIVELAGSKVDLVAGTAQRILEQIGGAYKQPRDKRKPAKTAKNQYACKHCKTRRHQVILTDKKGKVYRECQLCLKKH